MEETTRPDPPSRLRSEGRLSTTEIAQFRAQGVPLSFDPVQQGWVLSDVDDDIDPSGRPASIAAGDPVPDRNGTPARLSIALRPWRAEDVSAYLALLDDPEVWRYLPEDRPEPLTEETALALIELSNAASHHEVLAVLVDDRPVGQVRRSRLPGSEDTAEAEISYWLGRAHWGRGIGAAMVRRYVADVFARQPGLASLVARIHPQNAASAQIARRTGFHHEGPADDDPEIEIFRLRRPIT